MDLLNDIIGAVALARPRALWLLLAVPLLGLATWWLGRAQRGRWTRFGLRALTLALAALALARPTLERPSDAVTLAVLVDVSDSVADAALAQARARVQTLAADGGGATRLRLLRFAGAVEEAARTPDPGLVATRLAGRRGSDTDLGEALAAGLAALDGDRVGRLLLLSDGHPTRGDHEHALAQARARGVRIFTAPLTAPTPAPADVALLDLQAPAGVRAGASFELVARVLASGAGDARLRLHRDGADSVPEPARTVSLRAGLNTLRWPAQLPADTAVFDLTVTAAGGDQDPRNDHARLAVLGERGPRVLVLEHPRGSTAAFRRALAAQQMQIEVITGRLPPADALARHDLVVLADVPVAGLPAADQRELARYVRERGGGLLVTGGSAGFGAGGYEGTALDGLLPLRFDPGERKQEPTLALALVIDRSGSMSGPKMDLTKEAARGAAELMQPEDLIAVVAFDSQPHTVVRLQPASNRQRILADIGGIRTGGGTNILPGLREAVDQLLAASARRKHIIVLSDGQSPVEGIAELVDEAAAARITLSAVGVGDGADVAVLQMIASRGGGRFYHSRDPASVPRIFTRETAGLTAQPAAERESRARLGRKAEALAGIPLGAAPPLSGFTRARPRPGAEVLLTVDGNDPLLARWQQGLGQVMVWTSDLGARWSGAWLRWPGYGQLMGQLARSTMSRQALRSLPLAVRRSRDRVEVEVRTDVDEGASAPDGHGRQGLEGALEVRDLPPRPAGTNEFPPLPSQPTRTLPLVERAPGRYQASVPVGDAAALVLHARLRAPAPDGAVLFEARGQLGLSPPLEWRPAGAVDAAGDLEGPALLAALAAASGGRVLGPDLAPALAPGPDRAPRRLALGPPLLVAALALFLAELALRRASFRAPGRVRRGPAS
jgi:Ca-activated chloride channel homolog